MNIDLHCHSNISDGLLSPAEVVLRAKTKGVDVLALTDHDEMSGLPEAQQAAKDCDLHFINGVEISVSWLDQSIHIVGLGVSLESADLAQGLKRIRDGRNGRAHKMSEGLEKIGIHNAYEGALRYAKNPELISRAHFARYMVEIGIAKDNHKIFDHYLVRGKPGFVEHEWASLEEAIGWIHSAGGLAVFAHPGRCRFSKAQMRDLLERFKTLGGEAIEVVSSAHSPAVTAEYAHIARQYGFLASRASDFHGPGESYVDLGGCDALPPDLTPVWTKLGF